MVFYLAWYAVAMVLRPHHHLQLLFSLSGPCPPEGVQVSLECASNVGTVSWFSAVAADLYEATLTAQGGHTHNCNSDSTSCPISDLQCGKTYTVTVSR